MLLPASTGVFASIRDSVVYSSRSSSVLVHVLLVHVTIALQYSTAMTAALLVAAADPSCRPVVYLATLEVMCIIIGLIDRGVMVGVYSAFQYGNWLQPAVSALTVLHINNCINLLCSRLGQTGRIGILRM